MNGPKRWLVLSLLFSALVPLAVGCGGHSKTVKVEGIVTLDGKPLPGATVTFSPIGEGRAASGRTDVDGSFRLTTFRTDDGAVPGEYKVIVVVEKESEVSYVGRDPEAFSDKEKLESRMTMSPKGRKVIADKLEVEKKKKAAPPVPAIYSDVTKTPLKETVPPDGKITLALRSGAS